MYVLSSNHGTVKANERGELIIDGKPCEQWRILGVHEILPFGRLGGLIPLEHLHDWVTDWTFKNGRPRYRVADLDHGTRRVWGANIYRIWSE